MENSIVKNYKVLLVLEVSSFLFPLSISCLQSMIEIESIFGVHIFTSGQLEFEEFKSLIDEVWRWKEAFDYFDTDKSGSIDFGELQQALIMIGCASRE